MPRIPTTISLFPTQRRATRSAYLNRDRTAALEKQQGDNYLAQFARALESERQAGISGFEDYLNLLRGDQGGPAFSSEFVQAVQQQAVNPIKTQLKKRVNDAYASAAARGLGRHGGSVNRSKQDLQSQANVLESTTRGAGVSQAGQMMMSPLAALAQFRLNAPIADPGFSFTASQRNI